jgi:hypothetical protein
MTTAKWTINTREQQDLLHPAARFHEKVCLLMWGGDALTVFRTIEPGSTYLSTLAASRIIQSFVKIVRKFKNILFSKNKNL